jgi:hypothetical protein
MKKAFLAQGDWLWVAALPTVIFATVFLATIWWVATRDQKTYTEVERLPLDDSEQED